MTLLRRDLNAFAGRDDGHFLTGSYRSAARFRAWLLQWRARLTSHQALLFEHTWILSPLERRVQPQFQFTVSFYSKFQMGLVLTLNSG